MGKTTHNGKHIRKLRCGKNNAQWKAYSESKPRRQFPRKRARCSQQTTETSARSEQDNQETTEPKVNDEGFDEDDADIPTLAWNSAGLARIVDPFTEGENGEEERMILVHRSSTTSQKDWTNDVA